MRVEQRDGRIGIDGREYQIEVDATGLGPASLRVGPVAIEIWPEVHVDAVDQPDRSGEIRPPRLSTVADGIEIEWIEGGGLWPAKRICLRCRDESLELFGRVEADTSRRIERCRFLASPDTSPPRRSSGSPDVGLFNPEPTTACRNHFGVTEPSALGLYGPPALSQGRWFFTPPPYCYALGRQGGWLALGVAAPPGARAFTRFDFDGDRDGFGLTLQFDGQQTVAGSWETPRLALLPAADEYAALSAYAEYLRADGTAPTPTGGPGWWQQPIFCGWGEQVHLERVHGGRAADHCRQGAYEQFVAALAARGIDPGIVVVDDKWSTAYGESVVDREKWPDLPGFIGGQHAAGRRVLLWFKAWDPEGVPAEECVRDAAGRPLGVDPTSPAYQTRLRRLVRTMLHEYDADGFKVDFTACVPIGPEARSQGGLAGVDLLHRLLAVFYEAAKSCKPDALVMAHCANPYFADVVDVLRLNDVPIWGGATHDELLDAMRHRARVAAAAWPGWPIDTDNWPSPDRGWWRRYLAAQPNLGIPSLYYATHIDQSGEPLTEDDDAALARVWGEYRGRVGSGR